MNDKVVFCLFGLGYDESLCMEIGEVRKPSISIEKYFIQSTPFISIVVMTVL